MIKLIDKLPEYDKTDFAYAKLCCNFAAYKEFNKIALFWAQNDQNNKVTALLSMIDGSLTLTENGADLSELKVFISALGPKIILCEEYLADTLNLKKDNVYTVLKSEAPYDTLGATENTGEGVMRLYDMLKNDFPLEKDGFLADVSHRVRHNSAFFVTSSFGAALCLYCENFAVINGICVSAEKRGTGLGSAILKRVKSGARNKPIFVASRNADNFYLKNNFKVCGKAAYCSGDNL